MGTAGGSYESEEERGGYSEQNLGQRAGTNGVWGRRGGTFRDWWKEE